MVSSQSPINDTSVDIPRSEYPRPQWTRDNWLCLNGEWQFEIDAGDSGLERGLLEQPLSQRITVPFCPESSLSGIGNTDFMPAVWYRRVVTVPSAWTGHRVMLHFQAVDYDATVWANGVEVGRHRGGFTPFTCDLSGIASGGEELAIVVRARDDRESPKPRGKQSQRYGNYSVMYTRTTGIWQSVWLEPVPQSYLLRPHITPDAARSMFRVTQPMRYIQAGMRVRAALADGQGDITSDEVSADADFSPTLELVIPKERVRLWEIGNPHLYDLRVDLLDASGAVVDSARSYAGLRGVTIDGKAIKLNGRPVFQRLVLDQGYYPDGIMTAPSDEALKRDITLSMEAGFNGARLHQKVFEERFLYHADRMGYLVWSEFGDWGCNMGGPSGNNQKPSATYITQWLEALERDYSHPSIVGWCPLNETWQQLTDQITVLDDVTHGMYLATKAMDTSRPVLDASGYSHRVRGADIYDCHDYEQNPDKFADNQGGLERGEPYVNRHGQQEISIPYAGQPYFVSEFGGIRWNPEEDQSSASWGYGESPRSLDEFYSRFEGLCAVLLGNPDMFGYCYTQLTDVYQEQNGIYTFDREQKFDLERLRAAQQRPAAIERG